MSAKNPGSVPEVQPPFKLERFFGEFEFNTPYLMSCSDPESMSMKELVDLADDESRGLWENLSLGYTDMKGHPLLRKEVAKLHGVQPENIVCAVPNEGIYLATKTLANFLSKQHPEKPVHAITTFPSYQSLYQNFITFGCEVENWEARYNKEDSSWKFYLADFKEKLRDNTKIVVINFPHNPTGYIPPDEDYYELIEICRKRGIYLFSDEMYRLTNNDGSVAYPSAAQVYDNAISLFGLSKTFALAGLRIGWLATQNNDLLRRIELLKDYITICASAPSEILGIIALRNKDNLIHRTMDQIQTNLQALDVFASKYRHLFGWHRPRACTTGFMELKAPLLQLGGGSAKGFCQVAREEAGILLLPGALYDFPDQYVRIGFGRANFKEALDVLEKFIQNKNLV